MERDNSEGILRSELKYCLTQRRFVHQARRIDSCLLCRRPRVNEAGICDFCYSLLNDEELVLAGRWISGQEA